ncbi:MAG: aromatic acid decarboxylase [Syntrophobacteraceae bacterium CG2_30_61_12]|nr:MAG: aromatic acid decarboxylase [Syntrophobacteraceae bacterium CG2_30_61_12]
MKASQYIVAVTGASGAPYARTLLDQLLRRQLPIHLVASKAGRLVYRLETGCDLREQFGDRVWFHDAADFTAPIASGSFPAAAMVVVPCTMGTLAAIAQGISSNLIHRAADVCLKEGRKLLLVPRETPLSRIHLGNMQRAAEAGAVILPPMPGFYQRPRSVQDLVDFVVARILDQLGLVQDLIKPWDPETALDPAAESKA